MTTCTLIAGIISCTITGPRPTPAEAAAILAPYQYVAPLPPGPTVIFISASVTDGPFGAFTPFPPPRRLDGTLYSQPPWRMTTKVGRRR